MKLLLYCTKEKNKGERLMISCKGEFKLAKDFLYITDYPKIFNGKIVGECDFEVEEIFYKDGTLEQAELGILGLRTKSLCEEDLLSKSCLSYKQLNEYLCDSSPYGYAIHIKNLVIYDRPRELNEYYSIQLLGDMLFTNTLKKAPQNMQRVSVRNWEYGTYSQSDINILISIRPQWLCKILNGEKTIEVRKKVLKEMIRNE